MIKMIDLFAGIGGIRIAFENSGAECVMSSEIDKYACETYFDNFQEMPSGDITNIKSKDLPDFDILTGGFPCQPFSLGGLRKGFEDTRGTLFFQIERILRERKPQAFFLENVAGLVSHDKGNTIKVIENSLTQLGYTFEWRIMNACNYGIPQNRNRWYCIGFLKEYYIEFNDENKAEYDFSKFNFPKKRELEINVSDIVSDIIDEKYIVTETAMKNINKFLPEYLESERYNLNKGIILVNEIRPSRCNFRSDGISPCLTAKMGTGGNNVPVYVKQMCKLTEKQCLRIMSFPPDFKIKGNSSHSYKQIGNSVVVSLIQELASEIVRILNNKV